MAKISRRNLESVKCADAAPSSITTPQSPSKSKMSVWDSFMFSLPSCKGSSRFARYASVYQVLLALKNGVVPCIDISDCVKRIRVLHDILEIIYHESIIDDLLLESGFYSHYVTLHQHKLLVIVMAYDFQKHKFSLRPPRSPDSIPDVMVSVSEALWSHRVKMNATLARSRVAATAQCTTQLLPHADLVSFTNTITEPVYVRLVDGRFFDSWSSAMMQLQGLGITLVKDVGILRHCTKCAVLLRSDLLAFSADCRYLLYNKEKENEGLLTFTSPQDIASYSNITRLASALESMDADRQDIIVTNCESGTIPGHLGNMTKGRGTIYAFGVLPVNVQSIGTKLAKMGLQNVQLISTPFICSTPKDDMFQQVGLIFCNPPCTLTAVNNPIDYVMQEGDTTVAQVFKTQPMNSATIATEQLKELQHSLKFSQASWVAYFTRSKYQKENYEIVEAALGRHKIDAENDTMIKEFEIGITEWRDTSDIETGGYLCTFKPAPPKPAPPPNEVISKALKKGVITDEGLSEYHSAPVSIKRKKSKRRIFSQHDGIPMTFAAQQKITHKHKAATEPKKNKPVPFL